MKLKCYGELCLKNNIKHDKSELVKYKGKNYCQACLKIKMQADEEKQTMYKCLYKIYGSYQLPGIVYAQIKKFIGSGMSYQGIFNTIQYMQDNQGRVFENKYGIGLVKNYYYEGHLYKKENKKYDVKMGDRVIHSKVENVVKNPIEKIDEGSLFDD